MPKKTKEAPFSELEFAALAYVGSRITRSNIRIERNRHKCEYQRAPEYGLNGGIEDGGCPACYTQPPGFDQTGDEWCDTCKKREEIHQRLLKLNAKVRKTWDRLKRLAMPNSTQGMEPVNESNPSPFTNEAP